MFSTMSRISSISAPLLILFFGLLLIVVVGFATRWRRVAIVRGVKYSLIVQAIAIGLSITQSTSLLTSVTLASVTIGIGFFMELCGVRYGMPFGRYRYTQVLQPQLFGIPIYIGVAWWVVCIPAFAVAIQITDHFVLQIIIGAQLVAALDMFIDPIFVSLKCWQWKKRGIFFGIPLINYGGWFLTAGLIFSCVRITNLLPLDSSSSYSALVHMYTLTVILHSLAMLFVWPWRERRILFFTAPLLFWPLVILYIVR